MTLPLVGDGGETLRPPFLVRMPIALFVVLCAIASILGGAAGGFVAAVVCIILDVAIGWKAPAIQGAIVLAGFAAGVMVIPLLLSRRRRSGQAAVPAGTIESSPTPAQDHQPAPMTRDILDHAMPAKSDAAEVATPMAAHKQAPTIESPAVQTPDVAVSRPSAASSTLPEDVVAFLNARQNRWVLMFWVGLCLLVVAFVGIALNGDVRGGLKAGGYVAIVSWALGLLLILRAFLFRMKVVVPTLSQNYAAACVALSNIGSLKSRSNFATRIRLKTYYFGIRFNAPVLAFIGTDKSNTQAVLIEPEYTFFRMRSAVLPSGWRWIRTRELRVRNRDIDEVDPSLFHWGKPVVGHVWKHSTMSGGRDHRFKDNARIDVVRFYGFSIDLDGETTLSFITSEDTRDRIVAALRQLAAGADGR